MTEEKAVELLPKGTVPKVVSADTRNEWLQVLKKIGRRNITALLVEGGGELAASMLKAGIVNRIEFHIATKILGGKNSRPVVAGASPDSLLQAFDLKNVKVKKIGNDLCVTGELY